MIVQRGALGSLRRQTAMVSGRFDPLHPGHLDYFEAAASLGLPLLCNVSSDDEVRLKHEPLLRQPERVRMIEALRGVDYVHAAVGTTADVLRELEPLVFVKGNDWEGRLPAEEADICARLEIRIVYLDTVSGSSSGILERYEKGRHAA